MLLSQLESQPSLKLPKMKKYFIIYCRKSTDSEDKQLQSIEDQRNILTALAKERNLPILQVFHEEKSAKAPGRPIYNQMMSLIKSRGDIKGIICWKLNRLSRNPVDSGGLQWLIQSKVIEEIVTPSKIYLDADSDFTMSIEGAQANKFIRDLREDTIRGINSKIEKGWAPTLAPTGYRNTIEKPKGLKEIEPHPIYFPLVKELFRLALTGMYSIEALGIEAQRLGIISPMGKLRHKNNIYKLLTNPFYCGRFLYNGVLYIGKHERMLTDQEFDLVQRHLSNRAKPRHNQYASTGFIQCSCGYMIIGSTRKKVYSSGKVTNFIYLRCSQRGKCEELPINADELNEQVKQFLNTIKLSPRLVKWTIEQLNKSSEEQIVTKQAKTQALNKNLENVNKKIQNLFNLRINPDNEDGSLITPDEYKTMRQKLLVEKDSIEQELFKTDQLIDDWMDVAINVFDFATKALDKWENGTLEEKRTILNVIGVKLVLKNKKLEITPRSMFVKIQEFNAQQASGSNIEGCVRRRGFEPLQANAARFTVWCN
jgi:site-specific DNA recombinase